MGLVFVTSATGAVGPGVLTALHGAGHQARAVARSPAKAELVRSLGAEPVVVDLFDASALAGSMEGCTASVHLATHVPRLSRDTFERSWTTHNCLRTTATANLIAAAYRAGVDVFVKESITLGYGDHGDRWIAEDTPLEESNSVIVAAAEGERRADSFTGSDRRGVVLRFGLFYGPSTRSTDEALRLARVRLSMLPGPAGAYVTSTHTDDVASAVVAALAAPAGVYNVCDDTSAHPRRLRHGLRRRLRTVAPPTPARGCASSPRPQSRRRPHRFPTVQQRQVPSDGGMGADLRRCPPGMERHRPAAGSAATADVTAGDGQRRRATLTEGRRRSLIAGSGRSASPGQPSAIQAAAATAANTASEPLTGGPSSRLDATSTGGMSAARRMPKRPDRQVEGRPSASTARPSVRTQPSAMWAAPMQ